MIRALLTVATLFSVPFFPWPIAAFLALCSALYLPLLPLAAGIFFDTLYYTTASSFLPLGTLAGCVTTIVAFLVRSRVAAGIIGE